MVKHRRIFYGWYIVAIAFAANFLAVGISFYSFNAFLEPLCETRGWTRTDVNLALAIGTPFGFLAQLLYGSLVLRIGTRILMPIGSVLAGVSFIFLIRAQMLWQFYLCYIFLLLGCGAFAGIVANTAVNNWFEKKRGKAIGFASAGISFSGALIPFAAMIMILHSNMAQASLWIGSTVIVIGPLAWLVVRDWPEDYGLLPDGAVPERDQSLPANDGKQQTGITETTGTTGINDTMGDVRGMDAEATYWTLSRLIRTGAFWKLGVAYALVMTGVVGVMSQLKPRFVDLGFSDMSAMGLMAATAFIGAIGKYVWGMLCDRFDSRRIAAILAAANGVGLALALVQGSLSALALFILIFGFAMGGVLSTYPIIVAELFGRKSFPAVFRFLSVFLMLNIAGFIIAGQSYDRTGSYDLAYTLFVGFDFLAAFTLLSVSLPQARQQ